MNWLNINSIHQSFIFAWEQLKINQFAVYKVFFVCYFILFIIMFHVFSSCQDSRNLYFCLYGELHWETAGRLSVRQFQWKHFPFPCTQFFPSVGEGVWPLSQHLSISEVPFFFPEDERRCNYILPLSGERILGSSTELPQSSLLKKRFL